MKVELSVSELVNLQILLEAKVKSVDEMMGMAKPGSEAHVALTGERRRAIALAVKLEGAING